MQELSRLSRFVMSVSMSQRSHTFLVSVPRPKTDHHATAQFNSTAKTAPATTADVNPVSSLIPPWKPKIYGESSADGWETSTTGSNSVARIDAISSEFDLKVPTSLTTSITIIDIGIIIKTPISSTFWALSTVHFEDSASD